MSKYTCDKCKKEMKGGHRMIHTIAVSNGGSEENIDVCRKCIYTGVKSGKEKNDK